MKLLAGMVLVIGVALAMGTEAQQAGEAPRAAVGTFDSRAVAIAWVGSDGFRAMMTEKHAEMERARAAGDTEEVARLEAYGPELQAQVHRQGFGTAPVDDILERIEKDVARIADERGLDLIVSRWAVAYHRKGASFTDVTEDLAACFEPDEKTWKSIREIVKQDPVPLEDLERMKH